MHNRAKKRKHHHPVVEKSHQTSEEKNISNDLWSLLSPRVALVLLSVISFLPSLDGEFVFDDTRVIVENDIVRGKRSIFELLSHDYWGDPIASPNSHKSYRPITSFTFWLNHALHGLDPIGYHLVNLVLHSIVTVLVYELGRYVNQGGSRISKKAGIELPIAIAFAVHPVHSEAVANISGRAEMLMCMFSLMAVLFYLHRRQFLINLNPTAITCFLLIVMLSMFSKEQGIMTLTICLFLELLQEKEHRGTSFMSFLIGAFCSLSILRLHINGYTSPRFSKLDNPMAFIESPLFRGLSYCHLYLLNIQLLVYPLHLCFDYSMGCIAPITSFSDYRILSSVGLMAIVAGITGLIIKSEPRHKRLLLVGSAISVLSFLPASNLLVTVGFTLAERVLYLPSVGICILLGVAFEIAKKYNSSIKFFATCVMYLVMARSFQRSLDWRDSLSLYSSGVTVCPNNAKIHYNLGKVLGDSGDMDMAEVNYRNAISLNPSYDHAMNNLGNLLEARGRLEAAEKILLRAVTVSPRFAAAWMNLGVTQMKMNKLQESESSFRRSLQLRPHSADCLYNLGNLYLKQKHYPEAKSSWINATLINPTYHKAWVNLFVLLDELDEQAELLHYARQSLLHSPDFSSAYFHLGSCYGKSGQFPQAEYHLKRAIELSPATVLYRTNLGVLYQRWNRLEDAGTAYSGALALDPNNLFIRENLETVRNRVNRTVSRHN